MTKQMTVYFSGRVQGVGFRYTVDRIAQHFKITGYVKNLPDGRVCLLAEGEELDLQDFLTAIRESQMSEYIRDFQLLWSPAQGQYQDFGIAV